MLKIIFKRVAISFVLLLVILLALPLGYFMLSDSIPASNLPKEVINNYKKDDIIVYLINLDRSVERYEYVLPSLQRLGYDLERFSAVDGRAIPDNELSEFVDFDGYYHFMKHMPEKGTVGCSLSHFKVWKKFLESDYKYALVFEDDVSFDPEALRPIIDELKEYDHKWDIVNLESAHGGMPVTIQKLGRGYVKLSVYLTKVTHTGAYLIDREAARKLLLKAYPINMPVDHYFTRAWELDMKFTGVEPRLVYQTYGDSEIGHTRILKQREKSSTIAHYYLKIKGELMQIQTDIIRFLYNLKLYFQLKDD